MGDVANRDFCIADLQARRPKHCVTNSLQTRSGRRYKKRMASPDHVLVVDDDAEIRNLLSEYLHRNGYRVSTAEDGRSMLAALQSRKADLIVLDVMMPGTDGLTLCRDLRARASVPVIMLTARGDETDRIVGLEMGADDYLAKPFNPRELLARIKSVLRRARTVPGEPAVGEAATVRFAGWTLDVRARHLVAPDDVVVPLSGVEFKLLTAFLAHPNTVLTRDQLIDLMLARDAGPFDRAIDVQVSRLRQRLRDDARNPTLIKTIRGEGYVLAAHVEQGPG